MKNILKKGSAIAVSIFALTAGSTSYAAESVNVAFFLGMGVAKPDIKS